MRERGILFSAPMVRALLAGSKTQTRRAVKAMHDRDFGCELSPGEIAGDEHKDRLCPYGVVGDRLWVRETWNRFDGWAGFFYAADDHSWGIGDDDDPDHVPPHAVRWKPSIFMPRAASRITLEITEVAVERLQAISAADALAEGVTHSTLNDPRVEYRWLWEEINGAGSWDADPWVWVVAFRRVVEVAA